MIAAALTLACACAQPPSPGTGIPAERLELLRPEAPEAYFLLGEEVADSAVTAEQRELASRLFVLAYDLDLRRPGRHSLAASAAVALAGDVRVEKRRRWLLALARKLDPRQAGPEWLIREGSPTADSAAYQVATVLGLIRSGHGNFARQMLARPDVQAAFRAYDRMISGMGLSGGIVAMERQAALTPCSECANQRVIRKPGPGPVEYRLCPACEGNPGPRLTRAELLTQLRFESWLLQGSQRSWAAQMWIDFGEPLLDPEPGDVAPAFGVDTSLTLWRDGQWTAPDATPAPGE